MREHRWLWWLFFAAAAINLGTAALRLHSFFPTPQAVDFASYYAGAWSLRLGASPYPWSDEVMRLLIRDQGLGGVPPILNSPPLWAWLLVPFTALPFPAAATVWVLCLLAVVAFCHARIMRDAGYRGAVGIWLAFPITLTFGPVFLSLTLGQSSVLLLWSTVLLAAALKRGPAARPWPALLSWIVAVASKLYPGLWLASLLMFRRWIAAALALALVCATFGAVALLEPETNARYWSDFLPGQSRHFTTAVGIDDQSLAGFVGRVGTSQTYVFPGLSLQDRHETTWAWPWNLSATSVLNTAAAVQLLLGAVLLGAWVRNRGRDPDAVVYCLVLFSLLLLPHMDRYNHAVALPAIGFLWGRQGSYRQLAVLAFALFGLSRLNHLWALLPLPAGPLASGFGLYAVLTLMLGLAVYLWRAGAAPTPSAARSSAGG